MLVARGLLFSCMAMVSANVVSASAANAAPVAYATSGVAHATSADSLAFFAKVAIPLTISACRAAFACLARLCLCVSVSAQDIRRFASRLALHSKCS